MFKPSIAPKLIALVVFILLGLIQYPLWFGKGSNGHIEDLRSQIHLQREANEQTRRQNTQLAAEIESLKEGKEAVETRARSRLNMVKDNEVMFRFEEPGQK